MGAHPDDVELGCGGTLLKHLEIGDKVYVIILSRGEQGMHAAYLEECLKSFETMGMNEDNIILGNFPDGFIPHNLKTVNFIERCIKIFGIKRVYTHFPEDRHQDHRNCSYAVTSAARKTPDILHFEGPSTHVAFEAHYYVELSHEILSRKINALKCYKSQLKKGVINLDFIRSLARLHGTSRNLEYAEAFAVNHLLRRGRDV